MATDTRPGDAQRRRRRARGRRRAGPARCAPRLRGEGDGHAPVRRRLGLSGHAARRGGARPASPAARIASIDTSAARAVAGVRAVLTAADVPHNAISEEACGPRASSRSVQPVLAGRADPLRRRAGRAASPPRHRGRRWRRPALVDVEYEDDAGRLRRSTRRSADGAPRVHPGGNRYVDLALRRSATPTRRWRAPTTSSRRPTRRQRVDHAYLEPEAGVGWIDADGVADAAGVDAGDRARAALAEILQLPAQPRAGDRGVHGRRIRRQGGHDRRAVPGAPGVEDAPAGADGVGAPGVAAGAPEAPPVPDALPDRGARRRHDRGPGHQDPRRRRRLPAASARGCCSPAA